jgi:ABC-type branched-subunit amino acid transport system substrate-binding protein
MRHTWLQIAALGSLVACGSPESSGEPVRLGVLLPFTGGTGGPEHSFERAVLFAGSKVEEGQGRPLEVIFADTHSTIERGLAAADWLLDQGVVAVIGVESDELAAALLPELRAREVLLISPSISSDVTVDAPWFRLAPSTQVMAENLAKRSLDRGVRTIAMLHTADEYNATFARTFASRFEQLGGTISHDVTLPGDQLSYGEVLVELGDAPHVLLATPPEIAARVVNDRAAIGPSPRWYLTPALRTEVFTRNTLPGTLLDAIGVTPDLTIDPEYATAFASRWDGDQPLESSLFYYDSAALFAMGHARARGRAAEPSLAELTASIFAVARNNGIQTRWDELASGLADLEAGEARYYRGLTGPIVFDEAGQRGFGQPKLWTVNASGNIIDAP